MTGESVGREPDTHTVSPLRLNLTLAAALFFGAAAVWRLAGHVRGTVGTSVTDVVGTVLLTALAVVLVAGAVLLRLNRVEVDDTRVAQRVGSHERELPLEPGTDLRLRRELRGAPQAHRVVWSLHATAPGKPPIVVDQVVAPDFGSVLEHVAEAGRRHPELLADPILRAVLADPTLLDASAAELELAVDDVTPRD